VESGLSVEVLYELRALNEAFDSFYERFKDRFANPQQGDQPLTAALRTWTNAKITCRVNLTQLLLYALALQERRPIGDKGRALAAGTREQRGLLQSAVRAGLRDKDSDVAVAGLSSDLKSAIPGWQTKKLVVCWEHDWPECPIRVLALGPLAFPRRQDAP
jgi:hypothetical protein